MQKFMNWVYERLQLLAKTYIKPYPDKDQPYLLKYWLFRNEWAIWTSLKMKENENVFWSRVMFLTEDLRDSKRFYRRGM